MPGKVLASMKTAGLPIVLRRLIDSGSDPPRLRRRAAPAVAERRSPVRRRGRPVPPRRGPAGVPALSAAEVVDTLAVRDLPADVLPMFPGARPSAVLIVLRDGPQGAEVLLTRRSMHLRNHKGEISFPGGRLDKSRRPRPRTPRSARPSRRSPCRRPRWRWSAGCCRCPPWSASTTSSPWWPCCVATPTCRRTPPGRPDLLGAARRPARQRHLPRGALGHPTRSIARSSSSSSTTEPSGGRRRACCTSCCTRGPRRCAGLEPDTPVAFLLFRDFCRDWSPLRFGCSLPAAGSLAVAGTAHYPVGPSHGPKRKQLAGRPAPPTTRHPRDLGPQICCERLAPRAGRGVLGHPETEWTPSREAGSSIGSGRRQALEEVPGRLDVAFFGGAAADGEAQGDATVDDGAGEQGLTGVVGRGDQCVRSRHRRWTDPPDAGGSTAG